MLDDENSTDEIEITPEMIEAGVAALRAYSSYFDLEEDGVKNIYLAMIKAKDRNIYPAYLVDKT